MKTYKITNITNIAGKRDPKYNTIVNIEYIDNRIKKYNKLDAGDTMFLTANTLPLSIHRLRLKKLITVVEISPEELINIMKKNNNLKTNKINQKKPKIPKKPMINNKNNQFNKVDTEKKNNKKSSSSSKKSNSTSNKSSSNSKNSSKNNDTI